MKSKIHRGYVTSTGLDYVGSVEIDRALKAGGLPDPVKLKTRFAPDRGKMPSVDVAKPHLAGYGTLLGVGDAA